MESETSAASGSGALKFALAVLLLGLAAFFLRDYLAVRYGLFGSLVWLFFFLVVFFAGLAYHALFIVPAGVRDWYQEGLNLIWQHFFSGVGVTGVKERAGVPPSIDTLGAGVVDSHVVLALGKARGFSRAAGPGYVKLEEGEAIRHVIDLRPQQRQQRLKAMTRDGIPLEALVVVEFRVRRPPPGGAAANEPFPYDKGAIFQVSYFNSVAEGGGEIDWTDRVAPLAAGAFVSELSNYRLDDLYPHDEGPHPAPARPTPLERMVAEVQRRLSEKLQDKGIEVTALELIDVDLPSDVNNQRIDNLQIEWERITEQAQAAGDAEVIRQMEEARSTAEVELIRQIVDAIEALEVTDRSELGDVITLVTIEALENAALEEQLNTHPQILKTLSQVQSMVNLPRTRPELGDGLGGTPQDDGSGAAET